MKSNLKLFSYLLFKNFNFIVVFFVVSLTLFMLGSFELYYAFKYIAFVFGTLFLFESYFNKNSVNFYFSLPINRIKLFNIRLIVNWISLFIPFILAFFVGLFISKYVYHGYQDYLSLSLLLINIIGLTLAYFITILMIMISNVFVDSLILSLLYPIIVFVLMYGILGLFTMVRGFPIHAILEGVGLEKILLIPRDYQFINKKIFSFLVIGSIQYIVIYLISIYFLKHKEAEKVGIKMSYPKIYSMIKVITTFSVLCFITVMSHRYDNTVKFNTISDVLDKVIIPSTQYYIFCLVLFLIGSAIQRKKMDRVVQNSLKFMMIFVCYFIFITSFLILKKTFYEGKTIQNVENYYIESKFTPKVYQLPSYIPYRIKDKALVLKAKQFLDDKQSSNAMEYGGFVARIVLEGDNRQLTREHNVALNDAFYPIFKPYLKDGEVYQKVIAIIQSGEQLQVNGKWYTFDENLKKEISQLYRITTSSYDTALNTNQKVLIKVKSANALAIFLVFDDIESMLR